MVENQQIIVARPQGNLLVDHPSRWPYSGYNEIQRPRRKNVLIDYEKFMELLGTDNYDQARQAHQGWSADFLRNSPGRDDKWTRSIAIGSKEFVEELKGKLGILAKGRKATETDAGYQLREPANFYMNHFDVQKNDIEPENSRFWDING